VDAIDAQHSRWAVHSSAICARWSMAPVFGGACVGDDAVSEVGAVEADRRAAFCPPRLPGPRLGYVKRRDQILGAAAELFARHGYQAVGIDDIGAAVGVSGPALYYYFSGKEQLLAELLLPRSERLLAEAGALVSTGGDPVSTLRALVQFHIDFVLDHPTLSTVHDRELRNLTASQQHAVRRLMSEYVSAWAALVQAAAPEVDATVARAAVQATFAMINSTPSLRWDRTPVELGEFLRVMSFSALSGYVPDLIVGLAR
jgi:AcrR family transcriptional regulator